MLVEGVEEKCDEEELVDPDVANACRCGLGVRTPYSEVTRYGDIKTDSDDPARW